MEHNKLWISCRVDFQSQSLFLLSSLCPSTPPTLSTMLHVVRRTPTEVNSSPISGEVQALRAYSAKSAVSRRSNSPLGISGETRHCNGGKIHQNGLWKCYWFSHGSDNWFSFLRESIFARFSLNSDNFELWSQEFRAYSATISGRSNSH